MSSLAGTSSGVCGVAVGDQLLLLGLPGATKLRAVPAGLRGDVSKVIGRLAHYPHAVDDIRRFWGGAANYPPTVRETDRDVIASIERAIGGGHLEARVLARARTHASLATLSQAPTVRRNVNAAGASRPPASGQVVGAGAPPEVAGWSLKRRVQEIISRAANKLPGSLGARLLAFATPANIAMVAGGVAATTAKSATAAGWIEDRAVTGIGFAYAGLAAFAGLRDVHEFAVRTQTARSEADLNSAAGALAAGLGVFGIVGLSALLHRSHGEEVGVGGSADAAAEVAQMAPAAIRDRVRAGNSPIPAVAAGALDKVKAVEDAARKAEKGLADARKQFGDAIAKLRARVEAERARLLAEAEKLRKEAAALRTRADALLAQARAEAAALRARADALLARARAEEAKLERLAKELHDERQALAERYKAVMDKVRQAEAEARNLRKYGDKLGPTLDALKKAGKSAKQIIDSAGRTGGKPLGL